MSLLLVLLGIALIFGSALVIGHVAGTHDCRFRLRRAAAVEPLDAVALERIILRADEAVRARRAAVLGAFRRRAIAPPRGP